MRFTLIDQIVELVPDTRIKAVKNLTMAEEYLADHFPGFPVMPGVLMLEAMTQSGAWLVRASEDFAHSMVVLQRTRNVRYGQFLKPGQTLTVEAEILRESDRKTRLKAWGTIDGQRTVSARLTLLRYNMAETHPDHEIKDRVVISQLRKQFAVLCRPGALVPAPSPVV